ncbi:hypothetical protein GS634_08765 [Ruegeria atlantica]|uniref:Uncharacterized protein n=1 Tax=Ruegeria atlantica TaxID=81569 RepID=A0AA90YW72_9RHOB|nr:hypothetical protein [Ruegeria atlantica]NOE18213.1 hypothetical protein [Ruegeria atlantica]
MFAGTVSAFHPMVKPVVALNPLLSLNKPNQSGCPARRLGQTDDLEIWCYTMSCEAHHRQTGIVSCMKLIIALCELLNRKSNNGREILLLFLIIFRNFVTLYVGEHI